MKYCLSCCFIRAEDCCWFYEDYCCNCGSTHIVDDGLTREQYEQMTEDEKDEYEVKIQLEVENSPYFNEKSYKELALGNPDFWFGFRYDKYTRLTGNKKAGQKLTPEEEAEEKRKFEESMRGAEVDYYSILVNKNVKNKKMLINLSAQLAVLQTLKRWVE